MDRGVRWGILAWGIGREVECLVIKIRETFIVIKEAMRWRIHSNPMLATMM